MTKWSEENRRVEWGRLGRRAAGDGDTELDMVVCFPSRFLVNEQRRLSAWVPALQSVQCCVHETYIVLS